MRRKHRPHPNGNPVTWQQLTPPAPNLEVLGYLPPMDPNATVVVTVPGNPSAETVAMVQYRAARILGCNVLVLAEGITISQPTTPEPT